MAMRSASSASVTRRIAGWVPSLWMSHLSKCSIGPAFMVISGGWMIGPAFISAHREGIAAWFDGVWKRALDHAQRVRREAEWKHASRQPRAPARDADRIRTLLAREPWQGPGLRGCDLGAVARVLCRAGKNVGAECAGRQEHDLAIAQMRRGQFGDCGLCKGRRRTQDEIGGLDGFRDRRRDCREPGITSPRPVDDRYLAAFRAMGLDVPGISPAQPDFVTGQGEVAGGRERTVASTQHCNLQDVLRFRSR